MTDYQRRHYAVRSGAGESLERQKVEVIVAINGKVQTRVELRRPGMLAVIGVPNGYDLEMIEVASTTFMDERVPNELMTPLEWQLDAMEQAQITAQGEKR